MKAIFVHDEMLNPTLPLFEQHTAQKIFVFDPIWMREEGWTMKRIQFVADGLVEIPQLRVFKSPIEDVVRALKISELVTQATPNPHTNAMLARAGVEIARHPELAFANYDRVPTRFMGYWRSVERQFFPNGEPGK
jgi:hypothetical protein